MSEVAEKSCRQTQGRFTLTLSLPWQLTHRCACFPLKIGRAILKQVCGKLAEQTECANTHLDKTLHAVLSACGIASRSEVDGLKRELARLQQTIQQLDAPKV